MLVKVVSHQHSNTKLRTTGRVTASLQPHVYVASLSTSHWLPETAADPPPLGTHAATKKISLFDAPGEGAVSLAALLLMLPRSPGSAID